MTHPEFVPGKYPGEVSEGTVCWQSPSNIALVKYWGKKPDQIPANPSVSFTLDTCRTTTSLSFQKATRAEDFRFELFFEGQKKESFKPKILTFFERIEVYLPFLKDYGLVIRTSNSFPHSSGIASSASGMSALALCLMSMEKKLHPEMSMEFFNKKASFLARLGSGSACRSVEGELVVWGEQKGIPGSSDLFGTRYPHPVHPVFRSYQDTILLVDKGEKKVSSSVGHNLMLGHPFAESRFMQAREHLDQLKDVLEKGDVSAFIKIVENEALTLHAMMMASDPYFVLMKPNTLEIIQRVFSFREQTGLPLCFTLDAGANVHLLYPEQEKEVILEFIKSDLLRFCQDGQFIQDQAGRGAKELPVT